MSLRRKREASTSSAQRRALSRRGMSLVELVLATTIMTLIAGTLAALSMTVQQTNHHASGRSTVMQHARVVVGRIERAIADAHSSELFPGIVVFAEQSGGISFPHTLVCWNPTGLPAAPDDLPRFDEITIFTPSTQDKNELLMIRMPADARSVPDLVSVATWWTEIEAAKVSNQSTIAVLTDRVRVQNVTAVLQPGDPASQTSHSAVRFSADYLPSVSDWTAYRAGSLAWDQLMWPQNLVGNDQGVRRCWCRFEVQLAPPAPTLGGDNETQNAIPFFGSAATHYELKK